MANGMTKERWEASWGRITKDNATLWKAGEVIEDYKMAHDIISKHTVLPAKILVPLAGDSPIVAHSHSHGNVVVALEWVPVAVSRLMEKIGGKFSPTKMDDEYTLFTGERAIIAQGDLFKTQDHLSTHAGTIDVVYDKDAFGALDVHQREAYLDMVCWSLKQGGIVWLEVKEKSSDKDSGPPFHLEAEDIERTWGARGFQLIEKFPDFFSYSEKAWKQNGYLLKYTQ